MSSDPEDYHLKKHARGTNDSISLKLKIVMLVVTTNVITVCILKAAGLFSADQSVLNSSTSSSTSFSRELDASSKAQIAQLLLKLGSTSSLVNSLLLEIKKLNETSTEKDDGDGAGDTDDDMHNELKLAIRPHKLPLGFSPRSGSDEIYQPVGASCLNFQEELARYMTYEIGGECPVDDVLSQKLILRGCEPLPRRRCHPRSPINYVDPKPVPGSLWATPPDTSIIWDPYTCKSYACLARRNDAPGFSDCKDCFNLAGREKTRWVVDNGALKFGIDEVLKTKPPGAIRIGFDIGGGAGTFAARMRERNVTILTSSMNLDGPFNSFIASRGLIPIHVSVSQRLPFFENTLDIVHSMHVLSNWIPDTMLEFTLYDVYRVLRPGGIFWLDHFFCVGSQLNGTYVPMLDRVGFKKLRWHAGSKRDRGTDEWYFSALLEKPKT